MNAKQLIAAVAVFAATGSVFANDLQVFPEQANFVSTKTRAEVIAQVRQANADGVLVTNEVGTVAPVATRASATEPKPATDTVKTARHQFSAEYDIGA